MMNRPSSRQLGRRRIFFSATALLCLAVPGFSALKAASIIFLSAYTLFTGHIRSRSILWFLSVLLSVTFCSEVAFLHGVPVSDSANQLSRIVLFFLALGLGASAARSEIFETKTSDQLILYISVLSFLFKVAIMVAILSGWVSLDSLKSGLGFETVTDDIGFGLQRLQFPSDIALIFLLSCYTGGRKKLVDFIFLVSITINVFLSFSRYLFVAYIACLIIRYFRIRKLDLLSAVALTASLLLGVIFSVSLSSRFVGQGSRASDNTRTEQIRYLSSVIAEHPLMGTGIGSSVNGYKRSGPIPFSYEVQWYAMTMQFGLIGLTWFVVNLIIPLSLCLRARGQRGIFLVIFALWVIAGFTNPLIISLGSAFGLSILMLVIGESHSASPPLLLADLSA